MNNLKPLPPFKRWTLENFPFIEADFDAITNYELYCKIVEYLKSIADNQNSLDQAMNYVLDYFNNLNVQDEVNTKLDDMAESGELTEIIAQYLSLAGIFGYNTISDMSEAVNLANNSICYTLGQNTYNDGKGAFYKVRTVTSGDVVDGFNIVALDVSDTLIAERLPNYYINQINTTLSSINTELNILSNKKYIFIGDSYNTTDTPQGGVPIVPWSNYLKYDLGLSDDDYYNSGISGAGWVNGTTFLSQLQTLAGTMTSDEKNAITDIVVLGGINDPTDADLYTAFNSFSSYVYSNFPNALVTIGMISWAKDDTNRANLRSKMQVYNWASSKKNFRVIDNAFTFFHNYLHYQPDGHPNDSGSQTIAYFVANALKGGSNGVKWFKSGSISSEGNTLGVSAETIGSFVEEFKNDTGVLRLSISQLTINTNFTQNGTGYTLGKVSLDTIKVASETNIGHYYGWVYNGSYTNWFGAVTLSPDGTLKLYVDSVFPASNNATILKFDNPGYINIPADYC